MHSRGALELSINTLVIIILSLVILAGGLTLLYTFIGGATDIKAQLDEQTNQELERLLVEQGKQVALPLHVATVYRGETHVFGLGILNIGGESVGEKFQVLVSLNKVVDEQEQDITSLVSRSEVEQWVLYNTEIMIIQEHEQRREPILVSVSKAAQKGTYIFTVRVLLDNDQPYGNVQNFVVKVA